MASAISHRMCAADPAAGSDSARMRSNSVLTCTSNSGVSKRTAASARAISSPLRRTTGAAMRPASCSRWRTTASGTSGANRRRNSSTRSVVGYGTRLARRFMRSSPSSDTRPSCKMRTLTASSGRESAPTRSRAAWARPRRVMGQARRGKSSSSAGHSAGSDTGVSQLRHSRASRQRSQLGARPLSPAAAASNVAASPEPLLMMSTGAFGRRRSTSSRSVVARLGTSEIRRTSALK